LFMAVVFTLSGQAWARFGRVIYRDDEPKQFWWAVASYYLGGLFFIGLYLYKISN
jgi:hypothetical protein